MNDERAQLITSLGLKLLTQVLESDLKLNDLEVVGLFESIKFGYCNAATKEVAK